MKIKVFLNKRSDSKRLADVSVLCEEGDLAGITVRGFNIWQGKEGGKFVTPPNQRYQDKTGKSKYYHHLVEEEEGALDDLNTSILEAYDAKVAGEDEPPPADEDEPVF